MVGLLLRSSTLGTVGQIADVEEFVPGKDVAALVAVPRRLVVAVRPVIAELARDVTGETTPPASSDSVVEVAGVAGNLFTLIPGGDVLPKIVGPREPVMFLGIAGLVDAWPWAERPVPLRVQPVFVETGLPSGILVDGEVRRCLVPPDAVIVLEESKRRRTGYADHGEALVLLLVVEPLSDEPLSQIFQVCHTLN